ncbi:MAG: penicillin-binding protein 1B [Pseudomonadota bacterium]
MAKKKTSKKSTRKRSTATSPAKRGKKSTTKRARTKRKTSKRAWWRRHPFWTLWLLVLMVFAGWTLWLDWQITNTFEARRWDLPARVYAAPMELYVGRPLTPERLVAQLGQLGYSRGDGVRVGTYRQVAGQVRFHRRDVRFWDGGQSRQQLVVRFDANSVTAIVDAAGQPVGIARLDPLMIGSVFAAHGEDRLILAPDEIPSLLRDTLLFVEDRRFESHFGLDLKAIARAAWANLRAGRVTQGGSTLTQQLVKSYFLTNERSWRRKAREAVMSVLLELRFEKQEILTAYINEIYLGQDGNRAIHGFALASQFYFARPLTELSPAEMATLVAMVRGPSYYSPVRFADRLKSRRDRIITGMGEVGLLDTTAVTEALAAPLVVASRDADRRNYFPAFVDLVRRQLRRDYDDDVLETTGLSVFTTMDPLAQMAAQRALGEHLDRLRIDGPATEKLQGAVVVIDPRLGEVQALVGGRNRVGSGFNRALDAKRQIGSLIKPVVYLTALQSGQWHMASSIEDAPMTVAGDDGREWRPQNFSKSFQGDVPLIRALAESINVATVRLGLQVGLRNVAETLHRLGGPALDPAYPSLLLGAVELSVLEVANVYMAFVADGLKPPLRAVRAVVSPGGETINRYPLDVTSVAGSDVLYQLRVGLAQVMRLGTGRSARSTLGESLELAGKTGTSNDFRDAWFAGFSADRLAVVWVGNDDNSPTGLTGSRGALPVWTRLMAALAPSGLRFTPPDNTRATTIDYQTGQEVRSDCRNAISVAVPSETELAQDRTCRRTRLPARALQWLKDNL